MTNILFFTLMLLVVVFQGLHHGYRTASYTCKNASRQKKYSSKWHIYALLEVFAVLFAAYTYAYTFFSDAQHYTFIEIMIDIAYLCAYYTLFRYVLFNYIYNYAADQSIFYLSDRGIDGFYKKNIRRFFPQEFVMLLKLFILIALLNNIVFHWI